jgi:DMSO/TMAO reductase YedYZ molybdopterin-dependent catalytic subunit
MTKPASIASSATRREWVTRALAGASGIVLAGCDRLNESTWFPKILEASETLSQSVHKLVGGRRSMAQEFTTADLSPTFRGNGNTDPKSLEYRAMAMNGFATWRLEVSGLVEQAGAFTLAELQAMPARTQITRHDCVEGWSAIGQWTGVPLASLLAIVKPKPTAKYVVFRCADGFKGAKEEDDSPYYESVDMDDAYHPQTVLAYQLNGKPLPIANGAPLRLRVERQLGYKHAKYLTKIELVASFAEIEGGKGGYWEDRGYQWYAGI